MSFIKSFHVIRAASLIVSVRTARAEALFRIVRNELTTALVAVRVTAGLFVNVLIRYAGWEIGVVHLLG